MQPRLAFLVCSRVIGGHEHQAAMLARDLAKHVDMTVFVNSVEQQALFTREGMKVELLEEKLLRTGTLPIQLTAGWKNRHFLRDCMQGFDHVLISAGAVEAGVAAGIALRGQFSLSLYLPCFYDRTSVWGHLKGCAYNFVLAQTCRLFDRIITINRIQASIISTFTGIQTIVVPNIVRSVAQPALERPGKLAFIGRLDPQKRIDEIMLWADFPSNPFKEILVIGDGPQRQDLEALARNVKFIKVEFKGWLSPDEQDGLLSRNDVLLLNSIQEGEPLVLREALERNMRMVVRDITGVRGVSKKHQRFKDKQQFQNLLSGMKALHPSTPEAPTRRRSAARSRHNAILRTLQKIFGSSAELTSPQL